MLGEPLLAHRTEMWRMPERRHPYPDDAQDGRRSDEHAEDDEQHVCRVSTWPTLLLIALCWFSRSLSVPLCTHKSQLAIGPPDREGGAPVAVVLHNPPQDTDARA